MRILNFADGFESAVQPDTLSYAATGVSVDPVGNLASDNAQDAFEELQSDIDDINNSLGQASGIATLDGSGKVPTAQIPALALVDVNVVADIAARDALTVQEGDVAVVTDAGSGVSKTYIYNGSSWTELIADGSLAAHDASTTGVHGVTGDVVGTDDVQSLENKTLVSPIIDDGLDLNEEASASSPAAGKRRFFLKSDGKLYLRDSGGNETVVGSGSGTGINHIENPNPDTDTSTWSTYADAAGVQPVDGNGGSPNVTWTRSTSNPLRGVASFLLTKDAANRQGEGSSCSVTIDDADKCKPLTISFDYEIDSGTYADGDLTVYIVDTVTGEIKQPSGYSVLKVGVESRHIAEFQSGTSTTYKFCFHIASTSASAWTVKISNVCLGPNAIAKGTPITDEQSRTMTYSAAFGTPSSTEFKLWQVGDKVRGRFYIAAGTVSGGTAATITLPSGMSSSITGSRVVGSWHSQSGQVHGPLFVSSASPTVIQFGISTNWASAATGTTIGTNSFVSGYFEIPITGWSSGVLMSSDTDTRVCAVEYTGNSGTSLTGGTTNIDFSTKVRDTHGAFNGTTFTPTYSGDYLITGAVQLTAGVAIAVEAYVGGAQRARLGGQVSTSTSNHTFAGQVYLNAGEALTIRSSQNATLSNSATGHRLAIHRVSGPSVVMASEKVFYDGKFTSNQALTANVTNVSPNSLVKDSHACMSSGVYSCPGPGDYELELVGSHTTAATNQYEIYKNGVSYRVAGSISGSDWRLIGGTIANCVTGDTISIRSAATITLGSGSALTIRRI